MRISDDLGGGEAPLPGNWPRSIDIGYGVSVDAQTVEQWGEAARLSHMRTVNEIGAAWSDLPEEMREGWRNLARAAASEACAVLVLALRDQGRRPADPAERLEAQVESYMARLVDPCRMPGSSQPAP